MTYQIDHWHCGWLALPLFTYVEFMLARLYHVQALSELIVTIDKYSYRTTMVIFVHTRFSMQVPVLDKTCIDCNTIEIVHGCPEQRST